MILRWQSDGFRTYRKKCKPGLVYDVLGTQNCNYDYNVKACGLRAGGPVKCNGTEFYCALSEKCVPMSSRCDGHYDCSMEEDEQNCPLCASGEFACKVSEQCISFERRCNGYVECDDGTDERNCDICGHGLFHCGKSNECIPMDERCDGRRQCPHGEDEMLCKKPNADTKFTCQSQDFQIPASQVCDGRAQCPDSSDEMHCEMPVPQKSVLPLTFATKLTQGQLPVEPVTQTTSENQSSEQSSEDYDYDIIKNDRQPAPFPIISLALGQTSPPPLRSTSKIPSTQTTNVVKPVFSKPMPKMNSNKERPQTSSQNGAQFITNRSTKLPNRGLTTTNLAKLKTTPAPSKDSLRAIVQPRRSNILPQPKDEKVFIMQVSASPSKASLQRPFTNAVKSRTTTSSLSENEQSYDKDILAQITNQLNGGLNP
uniref:Uncharacterized protein n=1 Tax=Caenorhabditis japonica TaxID=281687 RepID=A0A8R1HIA9_CAEJA